MISNELLILYMSNKLELERDIKKGKPTHAARRLYSCTNMDVSAGITFVICFNNLCRKDTRVAPVCVAWCVKKTQYICKKRQEPGWVIKMKYMRHGTSTK